MSLSVIPSNWLAAVGKPSHLRWLPEISSIIPSASLSRPRDCTRLSGLFISPTCRSAGSQAILKLYRIRLEQATLFPHCCDVECLSDMIIILPPPSDARSIASNPTDFLISTARKISHGYRKATRYEPEPDEVTSSMSSSLVNSVLECSQNVPSVPA